MTSGGLRGLLLAAVVLSASCSMNVQDPVPMKSPDATLDLRHWNFASQGPVHPTEWLWDADVLWSPDTGGRPASLKPGVVSGGPETGGPLVSRLVGGGSGTPAVATASLSLLVPPGRTVGLQVGAFPGAQKVWVNGNLVLERGRPSSDKAVYSSNGFGELISVQPVDGKIDVSVELATDDPLVKHSEAGRLWSIGSAETMAKAEEQERIWRGLQVAVLFVAGLAFFLIGLMRRKSSGLVPFAFFLAVCLLKLLFNVEQYHPLLYVFFPNIDSRAYLFLNHGLNFLPFPFFVWFLSKQFPQDIGKTTVVVFSVVVGVMELWELLPFVLLAAGGADGYTAVMRANWVFVLNLFTVVAVLTIFERFYHVYRMQRPLAASLFLGGLVLGLIILLPVVLGLFFHVKYAYFLGWGLFLFLLVISVDLIRIEVQATDRELLTLKNRVEELGLLSRFVSPVWAHWFGKLRVEDLTAGDQLSKDAVVLELTSAAQAPWLEIAHETARRWEALLLKCEGGTATWVVDALPEKALALALEIQAALHTHHSTAAGVFALVLTRATLQAKIGGAAGLCLPSVEPLPHRRLHELHRKAHDCGASIVVDANLKEGLVVGGWRKHRLLSDSGSEMELFERESGSQVALKLETLADFEQALWQAGQDNLAQAQLTMLEVLKKNPLDTAARYFLNLWESEN